MNLPILFKLSKNGDLRYWECRCDGSIFRTRYGLLKTRDNHKWQEHERNARYAEGHGAYRSGEEVAEEHANSLWKEKKRNDAMVTNPLELGITREQLDTILERMSDESKEEILLLARDVKASERSYPVPVPPVLAVRYDELEKKHLNPRSKYNFPDVDAFVQCKLDGERCIASYLRKDGQKPSAHLFSRIRNEIVHCDHIKNVMTRLFEKLGEKNKAFLGFSFDGEVVVPGSTRNSMRSAISRVKEKHEDNEKIVYYIFDMVTTADMPFEKRWALLQKILAQVKSPHVQIVPVPPGGTRVRLDDKEQIDTLLAQAVGMGYEGIILRTPGMLYPIGNHRISDLIKVKPLNDEEYLIIGAHEGKDKEKGMIILEVQDRNTSYLRQSVRPCWPYEERAQRWQEYCEDPSQFVGKLITIVYKSKNEYGNLEEARATTMRDPDDMDPQ